MKQVNYLFRKLSQYHSFVNRCAENGITVWLTVEDNNLNKKFKKWQRYIIVDEKQLLSLSEYSQRINHP